MLIQCFCLIMVMKCSRKMLDDKMSERTKEIFEIQHLLKQSISIQRVRVRKINRAVKIRIYPNKEQITQIEKTIGCSRFLYNRMLADKIRHYQEEKKMLKNTPAGYKKRISMAERGRFSCAGECTVKSGRGFPEIFPGTGSGISAL